MKEIIVDGEKYIDIDYVVLLRDEVSVLENRISELKEELEEREEEDSNKYKILEKFKDAFYEEIEQAKLEEKEIFIGEHGYRKLYLKVC